MWEYTNKIYIYIYIYITVGFGKKHQSITRIFSTLSYWKILMDNKVLKELFSTFKLLRGNLLKDVDELWKKNSYDNL